VDYITEIKGNEAVLEQFLAAIRSDTCKAVKHYPHPYQLPTGEKCLNSVIVRYFLEQPAFSKTKAVAFLDKLRKLDVNGFRGISFELGQWIEKTLQQPYFDLKEVDFAKTLTLKKTVAVATVNQEHLSFVCYVAICHLKYGASYEQVTANEYFKMVTALGSDEVESLKKHGSGTLPKNITTYSDDKVSCKANDAFATIDVKVKQEGGASYEAALSFLCRLLEADFPKSYSIKFSAKEKFKLNIKGLPNAGVHQLFANAVRYPGVHTLIERYARLAMRPYEWYNDLEAEHCAMPGTFAVFALGLQNETFFDLIQVYLTTVDEEHQSIQEKFTPAFIERFGVTQRSLSVYIHCLLSTQGHKHHKVFAEVFSKPEALRLLLECKQVFSRYVGDSSRKVLSYRWQDVLCSTFGSEKKRTASLNKAGGEQREQGNRKVSQSRV
jgi:hypothetical protein